MYSLAACTASSLDSYSLGMRVTVGVSESVVVWCCLPQFTMQAIQSPLMGVRWA